MTIQQLLDSIPWQKVTAVTSDSREVRPGTVFVAVKGVSQDGHEFIEQAKQAGAIAVVSEKEVSNTRLALAALAARFYGYPTKDLCVIGVTGTCGKTTTTYVLESILRAAGKKPGVIGTVNFRFGDKIFPSTHTTPGPVELQRLLALMKAEGCDSIIMEVSSHALKQHRADFIAFDGVLFTNLSPEHLDFHPDMEDYYRAKTRLFTELLEQSKQAGKNPCAAVNADDAYGRRLLSEVKAMPFSLGDSLSVGLDGIKGRIGQVEISSDLTGSFNASNISGAVALAQGLGLSAQVIAKGVASLPCVPGRLERVPNERGLHVLVDYAHKPDALEKVLRTLGEVKGSQRLITVFGCGGDRDRTKRPVMGRLALQLSDYVWITSDNPRTEEPQSILDMIVAGACEIDPEKARFSVESDRKKAIEAAIAMAKSGDIVLIAGKGHEDYQILRDPGDPRKTVKIHFDDREIASLIMRVINLTP